MAYLERSAIVRIHAITNSSTSVSAATTLPVTPLDYPHNGKKQEESRLAFTQIMTSRRYAGNDGYFSHIIRTDEYTTTVAGSLPSGYFSGFERPLSLGILVLSPEMSCAHVTSSSDADVGIQTLNSAEYSDNVVDNSILVEIS